MRLDFPRWHYGCGSDDPRCGVQFTLTCGLRAIERADVLERRSPLFEEVTTGVVVGSEFFYLANVQDGKKTGFNPITILKLHL